MAARTSVTSLSEGERAQAVQRFSLLRPHLEEGVPLAHLAREKGLALRTLQRWVRRYQQQGLSGLVRTPRADRGHRALPAELVRVIEGLALRRPAPSTATMHRQVREIALQQGWRPPSYSSVYAVVRGLDPGLVSLAHEGPAVYRETYDLLYRREASGPNEIWQADHTPLDIWVRDDNGQPARPWLTAIIDDYSRAIAGYAVSLQAPSSIQTALALRQAIWRKADARWHVCGIPAIFYTDHGSDFTSHHLEQVGVDLHMRLVFSTPGVPRGRGRIERFFSTVNQLFLSTLPGYAPAGTSGPPPAPVLTLPALDDRVLAFLLDEYHRRVHSETGCAPQARWEAGAFLPHLPDSLEQLDLLLLTVAQTRRVQQDGIRFQGLRYIDLTLAAYVGENVTLRYDPRDMAEIRVYHHDAFLCRAVCQDLAGQTLSLKEIIQARTGRRRQLRTLLSDREAVVDALLAAHGVPRVAEDDAPAAARAEPPARRLKRYLNE